jgi:hypothetical protein
MKYAVEMGSGAMICIPSFIKTGPGIQKLMSGGDTQTLSQQVDIVSLLSFFENKESGLKRAYGYNYVTNMDVTTVRSETRFLTLHMHVSFSCHALHLQ